MRSPRVIEETESLNTQWSFRAAARVRLRDSRRVEHTEDSPLEFTVTVSD